jgi:2-keto-4-pentenoate hydratase
MMASGIARLLQEARDMGAPDNCSQTEFGAQLLLGLTEREAYYVQEQQLLLGDAVTSKAMGWKVGATSAIAQAALKLSGPFRAPLFQKHLYHAKQGEQTVLSCDEMGGLGITVETGLGWMGAAILVVGQYRRPADLHT